MENPGTKILQLLSQILEHVGYTTDQEFNLLHVDLELPENTRMVTQVEAQSVGNRVVLRVRTKVPDDLLDIMAKQTSINAFAVLGALHLDEDGDVCVGTRIAMTEVEVEEGLGLHLVAASIHYNLNGMIRAMVLSRPSPIDEPEVAWTHDEFAWAADQLGRLTPAEATGQSLRAVFLFDDASVNFVIHKHFHPGLEDGLLMLTQLPVLGTDAQADDLNRRAMQIDEDSPHLGAWTCRRGYLCYVGFIPNAVYHKGLLERLGPWAMERAQSSLRYVQEMQQNLPVT